MLATEEFEHLYRINEVAKIMRISETKVWQLLRSGELKAIRIGMKRIVVRKSDLLRYLEQQDYQQERENWKGHEQKEQKIKAVRIS